MYIYISHLVKMNLKTHDPPVVDKTDYPDLFILQLVALVSAPCSSRLFADS